MPTRWVQAEIDILAAREVVLRGLTALDALREWFAVEDGIVDARPGGAVRLAWGENEMTATFERAGPDEVVLAGVVARSPERGAVGPTRIAIALKKRSHNTRVTLREEGFGEGAAWDATYADAQQGWPIALLDLKAWAERQAAPA